MKVYLVFLVYQVGHQEYLYEIGECIDWNTGPFLYHERYEGVFASLDGAQTYIRDEHEETALLWHPCKDGWQTPILSDDEYGMCYLIRCADICARETP